MSNELDDRRGLLFTINGDQEPVYQVMSSAWAQSPNKCSIQDLPLEVQAQITALKANGKPGAFVELVQGDVGVYVIVESNITRLPEAASEDVTLVDPNAQPPGTRVLAPYDIIICTKEGDNYDATHTTQEDDCYVVNCQSWGRFFLPQVQEPEYVTTTKRFLLLLESLHGRNYLSMCPDPVSEVLPPDFGPAVSAIVPINCYVLNLSSFKS
ncbi:MAG: hypothetical protein R3B70_27235 [Polyangiaceae bacterium]